MWNCQGRAQKRTQREGEKKDGGWDGGDGMQVHEILWYLKYVKQIEDSFFLFLKELSSPNCKVN